MHFRKLLSIDCKFPSYLEGGDQVRRMNQLNMRYRAPSSTYCTVCGKGWLLTPFPQTPRSAGVYGTGFHFIAMSNLYMEMFFLSGGASHYCMPRKAEISFSGASHHCMAT